MKIVKSKMDVSGDVDGYLIDASEKIARSIIASLKDRKFKGKIGFVGGDDALNRRAIESLKIDYLVSPEALTGKDTLKQRDSGLNHVVAKMVRRRGLLLILLVVW